MIGSGIPISEADVARHYDELDAIYREVWGEYLHHGLWTSRRDSPETAVLNLLKHLLGHLDVAPGSSVCDVGCGYGTSSAWIADRYHCDVRAITLSTRQYERAVMRATRMHGHIEFVHGDWLSNPFRDGEFDVVVAIESLSHMPDKVAFFREVARVLRPGGRVGICAWLASGRASRLQRRLLLEPICREGRLPSLGTMEEYVFMMRRAGLEPMLMEDLTRRVRRTWAVISQRLVRKLITDARYRRMLFDKEFESRLFARTIPRMRLAFRSGALQYGMLVAAKPAGEVAA